MFANELTAPYETVDGAALSRDYTLVSTNGMTSVRRCIDGAPGYPNTLKISHQLVGKGANQRTRHLVRLDTHRVVENVDIPGETEPTVRETDVMASCYLVLDLPVGWENSQQAIHLVRQMFGLLRGNSGSGPITQDWATSFAHGFINNQV